MASERKTAFFQGTVLNNQSGLFSRYVEVIMSFVQLFSAPEVQIARARQWSRERGWGFTDEAFAEAERSKPVRPERPLTTAVLVPYLPPQGVENGVKRTFRELWLLKLKLLNRHTGESFPGEMYPERLRYGAHVPGLRWEVIDLGAQRGMGYRAGLSLRFAPSAGVLAAAVMHEKWSTGMDGDKIPYVWMIGYVFTPPHSECVDAIGLCGRPNEGVVLPSLWDGEALKEWAIPTFYGD